MSKRLRDTKDQKSETTCQTCHKDRGVLTRVCENEHVVCFVCRTFARGCPECKQIKCSGVCALCSKEFVVREDKLAFCEEEHQLCESCFDATSVHPRIAFPSHKCPVCTKLTTRSLFIDDLIKNVNEDVKESKILDEYVILMTQLNKWKQQHGPIFEGCEAFQTLAGILEEEGECDDDEGGHGIAVDEASTTEEERDDKDDSDYNDE